MSIKNKIVSPEQLVEKQGAKLLVYGQQGEVKRNFVLLLLVRF